MSDLSSADDQFSGHSNHSYTFAVLPSAVDQLILPLSSCTRHPIDGNNGISVATADNITSSAEIDTITAVRKPGTASTGDILQARACEMCR
jgi:hypothetical protein